MSDNQSPQILREQARQLAREQREQQRKRLEYSQKLYLIIVLFAMGLVLLVHAANFVLLWNNRLGMTQEVLSTVQIFGGIVATAAGAMYAVSNTVLKTSLNKSHRHQMSTTGKVKPVIIPTSQADIEADNQENEGENDA